jgi:acyl-CoA hydrolase
VQLAARGDAELGEDFAQVVLDGIRGNEQPRDGTCSLGTSVDVTKTAVLTARTVIAEVNPEMPRTGGAGTRAR